MITSLNSGSLHFFSLLKTTPTQKFSNPVRLSLRLVGLFAALLTLLTSAGAQVVRISGSSPVGGPATTQQVTVTVTSPGVLDSLKVRTAGSDGFDFSAAAAGTCTPGSILSVGRQCTMQLSFSPRFPGERRGAIVLLDRAGLVLGVQLVVGKATGAVGTFVPGTISTVAGDAVWIYAGDGAPATQSSIFLPFGIAVNAAGDLFIADSSNNRIRKVSATSGVISTLAGLGNVGATGDGGLAVLANLSNPTSLALDPMGNLYFADTGNNVIRKVSAFDGTIITVAGTLGLGGYSGDTGLASSARLNSPNGLAFDAAGDLYIADAGNHVVRMVAAGSGTILTVAGKGFPAYTGDGGAATSANLNSPWGITVSAAGELYIADQGNHVIRKVDATGLISTVVGTGIQGFNGDGGPASASQLDAPASVLLDVAGNLYIADSGNNRVRKVNAATGNINTVAGQGSGSFSGDGGPATNAGLYGPYSLTLDSQGSLFIADVFHNRIRKVTSNAATLIFPAMRVDRVSSAQAETLENDGNAPLNVASLTAVSQSQVDDPNTTCTTSSPLSPLDTCVISVKFAPTQIATLDAGTVSVTSNAANSPAVITLAGQVLSVDPATVTLTSSSNPSVAGTPLVFTVTVGSAGATPTGTVTLLDGTTVLTTTQLGAGGVALINNTTLTGGQHSLTASYSGDTSNAPAVSPVLLQIVKEIVADTTTSMAVSANTIDAGSSLRMVAAVQVSNTGSGSGAISGSVTFIDGTSLLGSAPLVNGTATLSVSSLAPGAHTLTATYGGNSSYGASTSSGVSVKVQQATSKVTLSTAANPSSAGAPLALSATLTSTGGIPSGIVTFLDGTTSLGTAMANTKGIATLTTAGSTWTVGNHLLSASYAGDINDLASISPTLTQQVTLAHTAVTLTSSLNPSGQGAPITFTMAVTGNGGTPGGQVDLLDGSTVIGSASLQTSGVALFSTSALGLGVHQLSASYEGDSYDAASISTALTQNVNQATTAISLASSANPALFGDAVSFSITVTGTGGIPSGSVTLTEGSAVIGTAVLDAKGLASIPTSTLAIGPHILTAAYAGDKNHLALLSSSLTENILQRTSTTLSASTGQTVAGKAIQWNVVVSGASGKPTTGTVALFDGQTKLAVLTPDSTGTATYTSALLSPGQHSISAAFAGDALDASSTSVPSLTSVDMATTTTTLNSSSNPSNSGGAVTLTALVTGNGGIPTGTVSFRDGTTTLTSVSVSAAGVATLSTTGLTPGYHLLTATYNGDTNDSTSTSAALNQQVTLKTVVTILSSANPSLLTDSVRYTVSVSSGIATAIPTGLISLTDNGSAIGSSAVDATGTATFAIAAPSLGQHTLVAAYAGDAENLATSSAPFLQTVTLRPSTTTFTSSSTSISAGQQIILVAVVQGSGLHAPTGQVTFSSGSTIFATLAINASGVATTTITPAQATYGVVATYSGDSLFAVSASTPVAIVVGPTIEFTLTMQPPTIQVQSGQHEATQLAISTAATFSDTLALGCAGLPLYATCTFSENQVAVGGGIPKTLTVTVDTGDPLGSGASAKLKTSSPGSLLTCMVPGMGLLGLLLTRRRLRKPLGLLTVLALLAALGGATGCGTSFTQQATAAGSYTFQVVATGNTTGATQRGTVQLTVTK